MSDGETLARAGLEALRRGDAASARNAFENAVAYPGATPPLWLLLAQARAMTGDAAGEEAALDRVLAIDRRNLQALLLKGDKAIARGDERAGLNFYDFALKSVPTGALPEGVVAHLGRAQAATDRAAAHYARHLESALHGIARSRRLDEAIGIAAGTRSVFVQQPTSFYFPGLPQLSFYERGDFDWIARLEAAAPAMRAELEAVLAEDAGFQPYIQSEPGLPNRGHELLDDPRWSAFHLIENGARVVANADRCPATMAVLSLAPIPVIARRSPMAMFSVLRPGTHIPPHCGMLNTRLIVHIPLIVPENCRLRVGNDTRTVEPGKAMIFDDSIEHEAWNDSDAVRVVLLFEVWRPELDAGERAALTRVFEAIGEYEVGDDLILQ